MDMQALEPRSQFRCFSLKQFESYYSFERNQCTQSKCIIETVNMFSEVEVGGCSKQSQVKPDRGRCLE